MGKKKIFPITSISGTIIELGSSIDRRKLSVLKPDKVECAAKIKIIFIQT